jgi:transposase
LIEETQISIQVRPSQVKRVDLSTHSLGSLYEAFEPNEAKGIVEKLEIHYTPKYGSWLNMAEIGIVVMGRQYLSEYIPTIEQMKKEIVSWQFKRNMKCTTVNWQFTTEDAPFLLQLLQFQVQLYSLHMASCESCPLIPQDHVLHKLVLYHKNLDLLIEL